MRSSICSTDIVIIGGGIIGISTACFLAKRGQTHVALLEKAEILLGWGGLYAVTPDENPIIEEITEIRGFVCATGFSGHGLQHGPAVGRILSELLLDGNTRFDLSPFAPDRFKKGEKTIEKRTV